MTQIITIEAKLPWSVFKDVQSGAWIGVCDALVLTALGRTQQDLHEAIFEAMDALFRDLLAEDVLDQYLASRGWEMTGNFRSTQEWMTSISMFRSKS